MTDRKLKVLTVVSRATSKTHNDVLIETPLHPKQTIEVIGELIEDGSLKSAIETLPDGGEQLRYQITDLGRNYLLVDD